VVPTVAPSSAPSPKPSSAPSSRASSAPADKKCDSNDGVYGDIDGVATTIGYAYELESNTTEVLIELEILPELERAIIDGLLSEVFGEECGGSERRHLRVDRRLQNEIFGISKNPDDLILEDGKCFCERTDQLEDTRFLSIYLCAEQSHVKSSRRATPASL
jgi:hypothetical protein